MDREEVRQYVEQYGKLRDIQYAAYEMYARKHSLTAKELFVLDLIWFAPGGCLQSEICERLSATRQTISAIIKKFLKQGYVSLTECESDRRNKIVRLTDAGIEYTRNIIPPPPMRRSTPWQNFPWKILPSWSGLPRCFPTV